MEERERENFEFNHKNLKLSKNILQQIFKKKLYGKLEERNFEVSILKFKNEVRPTTFVRKLYGK